MTKLGRGPNCEAVAGGVRGAIPLKPRRQLHAYSVSHMCSESGVDKWHITVVLKNGMENMVFCGIFSILRKLDQFVVGIRKRVCN